MPFALHKYDRCKARRVRQTNAVGYFCFQIDFDRVRVDISVIFATHFVSNQCVYRCIILRWEVFYLVLNGY